MDDKKTIIRLDDPSFEFKEPSVEESLTGTGLPEPDEELFVTVPADEAPPVEPVIKATPVEPVIDSMPSEPVIEEPPAFTYETSPSVETTVEASVPHEPVNEGYDYTPSHAAPTGPSHAAPVQPAPKRPKEKKYVTSGVLVTFMVITMIVSAMLGAVAGVLFSRAGGAKVKERVDSELSQLNLGDATGSELTISEIVQKNEDSVVEIVVSGTTQGMWGQLELMQGAGSGVIVKEDGYIATNYHVIDGASKVEVTLHNGKTYNATVVGSDALNDIAVIKIDEKGLIPVTVGDSSTLVVGDLAVAIGNPLGQLGGTATAGIISALDRNLTIEGTPLTLIQTDAAINGGNSGGGLFNSKGELIGIVESKASAVGVEGLAFALPVNTVSGIINDLIENGGETKTANTTPAVGIVISEVSKENAEYYGLDKAGVYVAQVTGENAKKAGFQEKDRIVSIDGKEVTSGNEFIGLVRKHKIGDTVTVVVERNGQEVEIKTELEALADTQPNE